VTATSTKKLFFIGDEGRDYGVEVCLTRRGTYTLRKFKGDNEGIELEFSSFERLFQSLDLEEQYQAKKQMGKLKKIDVVRRAESTWLSNHLV
jgi:hypothetical protein